MTSYPSLPAYQEPAPGQLLPLAVRHNGKSVVEDLDLDFDLENYARSPAFAASPAGTWG
jgi:hypothetical protein